ncbi:hypothetical protein DL96DRAFT_1457839, partial [Flagelloscypha sp. PMI_526]
IKDWLKPLDQTSKLTYNIQERGEGTCHWVLEDPIFVQWRDGAGKVFWFHGKMGTGKTVIVSFIVEWLSNHIDDYHMAYYFFDFNNPSTLSQEILFRSLISQLLHANPSCMQGFYRKHDFGTKNPLPSIISDVLRELARTSGKPIFIIIDALDELPALQRKHFLKVLLTLAELENSQLHIMITSRDDLDIHQALHGHVQLELAVQDILVKHDIKMLVDQKLAMEKWTAWPKEEVEWMRKVLNERADGQFRMLACQFEILDVVEDSKQLRDTIRSLPSTLTDTYEYIMSKIPDFYQKQAHMLFCILMVVKEPLALTELADLLAIDLKDPGDDQNLPVYSEDRRYQNPQRIVGLGTALVTVFEHRNVPKLQFSHASVKEFFYSTTGKWFCVDEIFAHTALARAALAMQLYTRQRDWYMIEPIDQTLDAYSECYWRNNWNLHILPDAPSKQLLKLQQNFYASFRWFAPNILPPYLATTTIFAMDPLTSAASLGLVDLMKRMLLHRSSKRYLDSALVGAATAKVNALTCCDILLICGANVNARYTDGSSPLHFASFHCETDVVKLLLSKGADIQATGGEFGTALQAAALRGSLDTVQLLIHAGANANVETEDTTVIQSAITSSCKSGYGKEIVQLLIKHGARINGPPNRFGTALHSAAALTRLDILELLLENGAEVNVVADIYGLNKRGTALDAVRMLSSGRNGMELVESVLLEHGALSREELEKSGHFDVEQILEEIDLCATCSKGEKLLKCSKCKLVSYCGKECQKKHWKIHKTVCT